MRWEFTIAMLIALMSISGKSQAQSDVPKNHQNVIKHFATTTIAIGNCDNLEGDNLVIARGMIQAGWNLDWEDLPGPYEDLWEKRLEENRDTFRTEGAENFCGAANLLYGINGLNVPGWLIKSTEEQIPESHKNIIKHFANATIASAACGKSQLNELLIVVAMTQEGLKLTWLEERAEYQTFWKQQISENKASALEYGFDAYCSSARMRYGKNGLLVKGLLVRN